MASEYMELISSLDGKSYKLLCCLFKTRGLDKVLFATWSRLIPPKDRLSLRKRIFLFLLRQKLNLSRRAFDKLWSRQPIERRKKLFRFFLRRKKSLYDLFAEVLKDGMISQADFLYIWRPIKGQVHNRMNLCWYAFLQEGCRAVRATVTDSGPVLEIRLTPDSALFYI